MKSIIFSFCALLVIFLFPNYCFSQQIVYQPPIYGSNVYSSSISEELRMPDVEKEAAVVADAAEVLNQIEREDGDSTLDRPKRLRDLRVVRENLTTGERRLRILVDRARLTLPDIIEVKYQVSSEKEFNEDRLSQVERTISASPPSSDSQGNNSQNEENNSALGTTGFVPRFYMPSPEEEKAMIQERLVAITEQYSEIEQKETLFRNYIAKGDEILSSFNLTLNKLDIWSGLLLQAEVDKNLYTNKATVVFGSLVGLVIVGFFLLSYFNPEIQVAVFSGESGIQFITLFSLIIAIILFGVLGILEGKELSALLGGLSGYILGRGVGITRENSGNPSNSVKENSPQQSKKEPEG